MKVLVLELNYWQGIHYCALPLNINKTEKIRTATCQMEEEGHDSEKDKETRRNHAIHSI
jgi:hypothetical protein